METAYKGPRIRIPTRSHVHEAQFSAIVMIVGEESTRSWIIWNIIETNQERERDTNVQAEIACRFCSPCLWFRSELLRQALT